MPILIERTDGVSIMYPKDGADVDAAIAKWKSLHVGKYVSHGTVKAEDLPANRDDRDAWVKDGAKVKIDPVKKAVLDSEKAAKAPK